ncbi:retrovirus-related Pol polyprotein from transposon opus [Trichonephila clavipes]|nr:retrovirus-related Pol polyprotein from transposon opus [Trichonephila clavipes]
MKPQRNSKEVSKFLGMSQWYAKFIKNYADLCEPLYNLKRKLKIFIWSIEAHTQKTFDVVKAAITKAQVLKFPDFKKPFELFTDASSIGVGAVLNQEQRPVVFASRTLNAAKRNCTVTERECLAVVWALNKFRTYLGSLPIKVNDWVLVATHPLSSATRKVTAKFKPKYGGPYRVLDVKNNNVVIWKAGKRLTINVDQVRIYRLRKCDEMEIGTGSSYNGSLHDESSGFDRVQRRSNESQDGKKKGREDQFDREKAEEGTIAPTSKSERTRSSNKNARRGGDQQRQDQERRGASMKKSLSLEVLVGYANYKS